MTRTLILIAGVGFVVAIACLGGAAALGGRELAEHGWTLDGAALHGARFTIDDDNTNQRLGFGWTHPSANDGGGPTETREIAWSGADALEVDVPADVQFTQAAGPGKMTITGPKGTVDRIVLSGPKLRFDDGPWRAARVTIVMTAPNVHRFDLNGDNALTIAGYNQDELDLDVSGAGRLKGEGRTGSMKLDVSGDGQADLARLVATSADVDVSGFGRSTIAPSQTANLDISGAGEVELASHPADIHTDVSGSGRVVQSAPAAAPATSQPR
jgi:hypothetical protein